MWFSHFKNSFLCLCTPVLRLSSRPSPPPPSHTAGGEDGEARERDEIRHDRRKERQHDRNISRAAPDKRCWTRTLNTPHMNSPIPPHHTHTHPHTQWHRCTTHLWIIHRSSYNSEEKQQDLSEYWGSSRLQWSETVCTCKLYDQCVSMCSFDVHTVRLLDGCGSLEEWRSGIQKRAHYNHSSSCLKAETSLS